MNIENKREEILRAIEVLEKRVQKYGVTKTKGKLLKVQKAFQLNPKRALIKTLAVMFSNVSGMHVERKINTFWGREMNIYLDDLSTTSFYLFGCIEYGEFSTMKFLVKNLRDNDIFYDLGTNYGFYTLLAQELIETGEIHSFEPIPEVFSLLQKNAKPDIHKNTFLNNVAVSDKNGEIEFLNSFRLKYSALSSIISSSEEKKRKYIIKVPTISLDEYIKRFRRKPPAIIKVDVEGAEYLVFKGASELLEKYAPLIIMEYGKDNLPHKNAADFLRKLGYKMYYLSEEGELIELDREDVSGNNVVFSKDISRM